ncbi:sigma-70 family RNA polymerase sigma factor [uncultured Megasphaera sp.]|uniref:sigma-70 family RNA polymerase sigma factor n=1 Tax=uncultured Megasphaera sp. TaxID=165188 RepID=UPI002607D1CE|nr:sigma-70 family RNA polymerase sigma factor [uncultured Megasphaera sp.]
MTIQLRQCVRAAQRGDKLAAEEVIREFKPFLNKQAKQYQSYYHNFYEALSTAYQGAMHCILQYDLEQPETVAEVMVASVHNHFRRESYGHQCYCDRVEKNVFDNETVTDLPENALASDRDCPEHNYLQTEISLEMDKALEILPDLQRQLILQHVIDGDSYSQLAKEYYLSKATVGYQVNQGLLRLRRHMTEERPAG